MAFSLIHDYVTPAEASGYARASIANRPENTFDLGRFLPDELVDDIDYSFSRGPNGLVEVSEFRTYDAEARVGRRRGITKGKGSLPPISEKLPLGEEMTLRLRNADLGSYRDQIFNDVETTALAIAGRVEIAKGEAIFNAKVTLVGAGDEDGLKGIDIDYGRNPAHTVTTTELWDPTNADADPITDIGNWVETFYNTNGVYPTVLLTSRKVRSNLLRIQKMRTALNGSANVPDLLTISQLNEILQGFDLPGVEVNDASVLRNGSAVRVTPQNKVALLAPGLGNTQWGVTREALEPGYGLANGEQAGIVSGNYRSEDPIVTWTKSSAIVAPVVKNPDYSFVATVTA